MAHHPLFESFRMTHKPLEFVPIRRSVGSLVYPFRRPADLLLRHCWLRACILLACWMAVPSHAAMGDPSANDPPWLTAARADLKAQRFEQMAEALRVANAASSADWHNLLGYALRKKTPPDLTTAEVHYKRALEIDPKHRLALEYYGELFLMKGDLAGAEAMLARLDKVCFFGCEEFRDLKASVARFKAQAGKGK